MAHGVVLIDTIKAMVDNQSIVEDGTEHQHGQQDMDEDVVGVLQSDSGHQLMAFLLAGVLWDPPVLLYPPAGGLRHEAIFAYNNQLTVHALVKHVRLGM